MSKTLRRASTAYSRLSTTATLRTKDRSTTVFVKLSDTGEVVVEVWRDGGLGMSRWESAPPKQQEK